MAILLGHQVQGVSPTSTFFKFFLCWKYRQFSHVGRVENISGVSLDNNKIKFKKCSKIKTMLEKGFKTVPQLEVNGKVLTPQEIEQFLRGE